MTARTLTLRGDTYPLVLPNIRDPRLHVAAVIITIHVLGQVTLNFRVSIPQILAAILTCAVLEVLLTFRSSKAFVWPASAMLTGSGVALILRLTGQAPNDHWTFDGWYVFATVAGLALLSKYVIRYRGNHIFNPSNIGLVVAFLVLGMTRVEPLDFWWGPLDLGLVAAYAVILIGGTLITRRLKLLALAATFWLALAAGLGVLAASGHCMTANWAFAPVCGVDYWRVIVTSPEVMIFLFFMITDPKTVPLGQVGRVMFGLLVAIACVLLMAPQTDEWWTKVGLLSGLVLVCAVRPLLDRAVPEPRSAADDLRTFAVAPGLAGAALAVGTVLLVGAGIVLAGTPARGVVVRDSEASLDGVPVAIDPATLPEITVSEDVTSFDHELAGTRNAGRPRDAGREPRARERGAATGRRVHPHRGRSRRSPRRDARPARDRARVGPGPDPLPVRLDRRLAPRPVRAADRPEPRAARPRHEDRGGLRHGGRPPEPHRIAVRGDVRDAPRDGRSLAQRRGAAGWSRSRPRTGGRRCDTGAPVAGQSTSRRRPVSTS